MNEDLKERLEKLKRKNEEKRQLSSPLFKECIDALGDNTVILSQLKGQEVVESFEKTVIITSYGRIDWDKMTESGKVRRLFSINEINPHKEFYIIWDNLEKPVVEAKLCNIIKAVDDVTAVSFDTWLFSKDFSTVIEFYHEGETTIGLLN